MTLLVLSLAMVVAQATQTADVAITIERTACFGTCPVYKVSIDGSGRVEYEGRDFVRVKGHQTATVAPGAVSRLVDAFERARYFDLEDKYEFITNPNGTRTTVTDLPTTTSSIRIGRRSKQVVDYVGAPAELRRLEEEIDRVARSERWIFVDSGAIEELQRGGWSAAGEEGAQYLRNAVVAGNADTSRRCFERVPIPADRSGLRFSWPPTCASSTC